MKAPMNIPAYILALSQQLHTQDNRCTDNPIFQVRDVKQVPCFPEHADDHRFWCKPLATQAKPGTLPTAEQVAASVGL